jgi:hypothetical protein
MRTRLLYNGILIAILLLCLPLSSQAYAQIGIRVKTAYVDDKDLLILQDGVQQALHESEWAVLEGGEPEYDLWLSDWTSNNDSTKRELSVLVELRSSKKTGQGRPADRQRVFYRIYWRDFRRYVPETRRAEGFELTGDLVEESRQKISDVASIVSYFNGTARESTAIVPADSSNGLTVSIAASFASFYSWTATPIELYELTATSLLVVEAAKEMVESERNSHAFK